jgi:penicillin-binding protein 1C
VTRARVAAALVAASLGSGALMLWLRAAPVPAFAEVRGRFASSEGVLLDRHGRVIHERRVDPSGRRLAWTPLAEVAPVLVEALLAAEDRRFRAHAGVDPLALAGAARDALRGGPRRGASTLTMQVAALVDPALRAGAGGRGLLGKARQLRAALALERRWSKDEILEAHLNLASFRGELVGVAAAAQGLFGRAPHGLGEAEAALLVALLPAPNAAPDAVVVRACRQAARREGVSCAAIEAGAAQAFAAAPVVRPALALAPHVAARLLRPAAAGAAPRLRVATTLDAGVQRRVSEVLQRQLLALAGRNVRDAAALVVENASGEVRAWVGSSGSLASAPQVDGVRARRQAGSSLKPFLYARALDRRLVVASTHLDDTPLDVATPAGSYRPENYDRAFRGPVSVRAALASSLNVPAVRLLQLVGVDDFVAALRGLGFAGLRDADFYGDSLALGSADVSLLELVGAWHALARGGVFAPLVLEPGAPAAPARRVLSPEAAFVVLDVLADRASRAPSFGLESALAARVWSAAKTGTSVDMRDNWCVGATPRFTVGVWVGNFSGEPMWDVSGVDGAAPAWLEIVHALHRDAPDAAPAPPPGLVRTGGEWYLAGTEPAPLARAVAVPGPREGRIVAPQHGARLALDPDVPDARERLLLEAAPPDPRLAFRLDGEPLGSAAGPLLWQPVRGRHRLTLVAEDGAVVDEIAFSVR